MSEPKQKPLTVATLTALLATLPPELEVVIEDPDGRGWCCVFSGEVINAEEVECDDLLYTPPQGLTDCVVLDASAFERVAARRA